MEEGARVTQAAPTLSDAPVLKGRFPFRLGCTSFVLHADLATNVRALAPLVDDIEVVIFESDEVSPLPDQETLDFMRHAAEEHGVTYTIHLPLDVRLASPDHAERESGAAVCRRVIERMRGVDPFAYVAHVTGGDDQAAWASLKELAQAAGDPALVCVENLVAPTDAFVKIATDAGVSLCFDVGHAVLDGWGSNECVEWLEKHLAALRVLHVHGVADGKDHRDASALPEGMLGRIVRALSGGASRQRALTLEVFSEAALVRSVAAFKEFAS